MAPSAILIFSSRHDHFGRTRSSLRRAQRHRWIADRASDVRRRRLALLFSSQMRTQGERLFADYLRSHGIDFEYEPKLTTAAGVPDFAITWKGTQCFFDVKDRENVDDESMFADPLSTPDVNVDIAEYPAPYAWIRRKITKTRAKFAGLQGSPCGLVLFAATGMSWELAEPDHMLGAMYGDTAFLDDRNEAIFLTGGKMLEPGSKKPRNRTISGLITLRRVAIGDARRRKRARERGRLLVSMQERDFDPTERRLGVIVWENVFAATRFPTGLFGGRFDERWERDGTRIQRTYVGPDLMEFYECGDG